MQFEKANEIAAAHLISGATLDELKSAASDLRALSQTSALADFVDAKIKLILAQRSAKTMPSGLNGSHVV
jgi:hypothetical protein